MLKNKNKWSVLTVLQVCADLGEGGGRGLCRTGRGRGEVNFPNHLCIKNS